MTQLAMKWKEFRLIDKMFFNSFKGLRASEAAMEINMQSIRFCINSNRLYCN